MAIAGSEMVEVKVSDSIRKQPPPVKIIGNLFSRGRVSGQWLCPGGVGRHFQWGCPKPVPY